MLHKTESLIMADFILRILRKDKRLKHIEAIVKPFVNNEEHGYTIELMRLNFKNTISFAMETTGQIIVYIDNSALAYLSKNFRPIKLFENSSFMEAADYIASAIVNLTIAAKIKNIENV